MYVCSYCPKEFKNAGGKGSHEPYCQRNPNRKQRVKSPKAHRPKGSIPWNKGLSKETDVRIANQGKQLSKKYKEGTLVSRSVPHTDKTKQKLSEVAKSRKLGGYNKGSGRGIKGRYKGIWCDSSWELAYVIYCLDHSINIKRNVERREYEYNGKIRGYIPDFVVDGELIEIKGYATEQWYAKLKYNQDVKVLYESDLTPIIEYVKGKYGKDFVRLYG